MQMIRSLKRTQRAVNIHIEFSEESGQIWEAHGITKLAVLVVNHSHAKLHSANSQMLANIIQ